MKIAILDDYSGSALALADWSGLNAEITVFRDTLSDPDALADRLAPFEVIALMRERTLFDATLINALPKLKFLVTSGPRNESLWFNKFDIKAQKLAGNNRFYEY